MTDQQNTNQTVNYIEAPASWNTRYVDASGFECQLTLRSNSGTDLLKKAAAAMLALVNAGCTPIVGKPTNGNGHSKPQEAPKMDDGSPDPAWCNLHGVAMSRHEKNGQVWYSHRTDEGYCKGKSK